MRLTHIFRQAQQSGIIVNAHRINHGQPPQLSGFPDFYWSRCDPPEDSGLYPAEETATLVVDIVARRIPAKFGLDPARDIQVLTPMHRGPAGAGNLNALLQEALTPHRDGTPEKRYGGRVFRVGDKITQLRNNYHKGQAGIFNGTVGVVTGFSLEEQTMTVLTDEDEQVDYDFAELDELAHAYAITIHRSQGSEYPAVVIPLTTSSWLMLQRNLLYTGVTRAKQLIVLVGSRRALAQAVRTPGAGRRHTALDHRLHPAAERPLSDVSLSPGARGAAERLMDPSTAQPRRPGYPADICGKRPRRCYAAVSSSTRSQMNTVRSRARRSGSQASGRQGRSRARPRCWRGARARSGARPCRRRETPPSLLVRRAVDVPTHTRPPPDRELVVSVVPATARSTLRLASSRTCQRQQSPVLTGCLHQRVNIVRLLTTLSTASSRTRALLMTFRLAHCSGSCRQDALLGYARWRQEGRTCGRGGISRWEV